ncbi:sugar translocase [Clostridium estertheticum]|uniref:lipopolysaccharide biosynthesis protein n=1 Tax=Clostridium estertheticum TaxID=238834 RepID=UPI0013E998A7|nr:sugar translocase [Clostridium estertheticum]MBZ9689210.1 sugar translocase [Clostridium estertheticum]
MSNSRTENVVRNMLFSTTLQFVSILFDFLARTVFIQILGKSYLGVNGLFTNILTILSFAELGIGDAIIFSMYKPIVNNDTEKIKSLMQLYKKAYRSIGIIIAIVGVFVIPFLSYMIKGESQVKEDLRIVYCLFLANTVISYFFSYKKSIITAYQKNYIVIVYERFFHFIQVIGQIVFLYSTHNYIGFLIIMILCTFLNNYLVSRKSNKLYSYLLDKDAKVLEHYENKTIFTNVKALFVYKFGSIILNGTDNIIISIIIGIDAVGVASNYILIIEAIQTIIYQIMGAFTASLGNLNASAEKEKQEAVFNKFLFLAEWIYGFCSIALLLFLNEFIKLWIGKEYLVSQLVIFSLALHFFVNGVQFVPFTYRTTMGLFVQAKIAPIIATVINIVLSILLGYKFGLFGVFIATSIARFCAMGIIDPYFIYKEKFKKSSKEYFLKYFGYLLITSLNYWFTYLALSFIPLSGWVGIIVKAIVCFVVSNMFYYLVFCRTVIFKDIKRSILLTVDGMLAPKGYL